MIIKFSAIDSLFFRDGKAFSMGQDSFAQGIFPPYPPTIYGALRTEYFSNHLNQFELRETDSDPTNKLKIKGIYISYHEKLYAPVPNDIVLEKTNGENKLYKLTLTSLSNNNIISSCKYDLIPKAMSNVENIFNGWMNIDDLAEYLKNDKINENWTIEPEKLDLQLPTRQSYTIIRLTNHVVMEPKVGIKISPDSRTTEESYLYTLNRMRPINFQIVVDFDFDDINLPSRGIVRLGGRSGKVNFKIIDENHEFCQKIKNLKELSLQNLTTALQNGLIIKIYLETPSIFTDFYDPLPLKNFIPGIPLNIISCAIQKPLYIGGFNIKEGTPRPMYKAIPSGCIYYLKTPNGSENKKVSENLENLSEIHPKKGFGVFFIGLTKST